MEWMEINEVEEKMYAIMMDIKETLSETKLTNPNLKELIEIYFEVKKLRENLESQDKDYVLGTLDMIYDRVIDVVRLENQERLVDLVILIRQVIEDIEEVDENGGEGD